MLKFYFKNIRHGKINFIRNQISFNFSKQENEAPKVRILKDVSKKPRPLPTEKQSDKKVFILKSFELTDKKDPKVLTTKDTDTTRETSKIVKQFKPLSTHKEIINFCNDFNIFYSKIHNKIFTDSIIELISSNISKIENITKGYVEEKKNNQKILNLDNNEQKETKTIKQIENYLKTLTPEKLNDDKLKMETLANYSRINIDKAFEYFYDNINSKKVKTNDHFIEFLIKCFHYDKTEYLKVIYNFIVNNKININNVFNDNKVIFEINKYFNQKFNADICLLYMNYLSLLKNPPIEIQNKFASVFDKIIETKIGIDNNVIELHNDEILEFYANYYYKYSLNYISISNYLVKFFDNKHILTYIFKFHKFNGITELTNNIIAFYNYYGHIPEGFQYEQIKNCYINNRHNAKNFSADEMNFFYTIFKYNNMFDYCADLFNQVKLQSTELYKFNMGDLILNSNLESDTTYFYQIDQVYKSFDDKNKISTIHKTLALLKDGHFNQAISTFLSNLNKRINLIKDNDTQVMKMINHAYNSNELEDKEKEYYYYLEKAKLIDSVKNSIHDILKILINVGYTHTAAKELLLKYTRESSTQGDSNTNIQKLIKNIKSSMERLSILNYNNIKIPDTNVDDIQKLIDKARVMMYLNSDRNKILFITFNNYNIQDIDELRLFEVDDNLRNEIMNKINKNYSQDPEFNSVLKQIVKLLPKRGMEITIEESLINNLDKDILTSFKNLNEYIKKSQEVERKLKNKYLKLEKSDYSNNIKYIEETLEIELYNNKSILERIKIYKTLLEKIKEAVKSKKTTINFSQFRNINITNYPKNFDRLMKNYILNNSTDYDRKLQKHVYNRLLTYLLYYPHKLRGDIIKNKSIIPSIFRKYNQNLMSYIKPQTPLNHEFMKVMSKVDKLMREVDGNSSLVQTDAVFNTLISYFKIDLDKSFKQDKAENIANIKSLLGQDQVVFDYKYAVYIILFGIQHNQPIAIRLGEKLCSDLGYVVPSWLSGKVNRYLLHNNNEYMKTIEKIGPVNVASVYNNIDKNQITEKDEKDLFNIKKISVIDNLPFKGLEEILDIQKFSQILKNLGHKIKI